MGPYCQQLWWVRVCDCWCRSGWTSFWIEEIARVEVVSESDTMGELATGRARRVLAAAGELYMCMHTHVCVCAYEWIHEIVCTSSWNGAAASGACMFKRQKLRRLAPQAATGLTECPSSAVEGICMANLYIKLYIFQQQTFILIRQRGNCLHLCVFGACLCVFCTCALGSTHSSPTASWTWGIELLQHCL